LNDVCQQRFLKGKSISHESLIPLLDHQAHKNAPAPLAAADDLNLALNPGRRYAAFADQVAHHDVHQLAAGRRFRTIIEDGLMVSVAVGQRAVASRGLLDTSRREQLFKEIDPTSLKNASHTLFFDTL
jgi:hypothetical protein